MITGRKSSTAFGSGRKEVPRCDIRRLGGQPWPLIPLNMREPILITRGRDAENGLGFAPHGAGRNFSRSAYLRRHAGISEAELVAEETRGIDARFFYGIPDVSELPGAYKNAATMRRQIEAYGLAEVVDTIEPYGCIMAGDWIRPHRRLSRTFGGKEAVREL